MLLKVIRLRYSDWSLLGCLLGPLTLIDSRSLVNILTDSICDSLLASWWSELGVLLVHEAIGHVDVLAEVVDLCLLTR